MERKHSGVYLGDQFFGQPDLSAPMMPADTVPRGATLVGPVFENGRFVRWLTDEELCAGQQTLAARPQT